MLVNTNYADTAGGGLTFESASELANNDQINGAENTIIVDTYRYAGIAFNRPWDRPKKSIGLVAYTMDYRGSDYDNTSKPDGLSLLAVEIDWENKTIQRSDGASDKKYLFSSDNRVLIQVFALGVETWGSYGKATGIVLPLA